MIVSGGENVFPSEVEQLLLSHPGIRDATVIGVTDPHWGARLRAYVVKRPDARLSVESVRRHVRAQLATYKVPRDVIFVKRIPRSPTGKVVKAQLRPVPEAAVR
jgi:fatty-acyl-CoA synthase